MTRIDRRPRPAVRPPRTHARRLVTERLEDRHLLAAAVISELMADNRSVLADEDGDFSDWLEIRNPGATVIDLEGWYLTDDAGAPTKWQLPSFSIAPGSQKLLFASGKDRTDPAGPLHTNFKLRARGEYLGLVRPDGVTVEHAYSPAFPPQVADVAYGLAADLSAEGYFLQPTPGTANVGSPVADPARTVLVSEIMYHPADESVSGEYIELYNGGIAAVELTGWRFSSGIDYVFPEARIEPGEYLVVAADLDAFAARYGSVENVVGGWEGRLSNRRDTLELRDASGGLVDRVTYADQGDWATRAEGPLDRGSRGWIWTAAHDGGGSSLELIDLLLPNQYGQNWASSVQAGGTPGRANSVAETDVAPLILDVVHGPILPQSTDPVTVTARLVDELASGAAATLYWRVDGRPTFHAVPMRDDGQSGDGQAGDGRFAATIPAKPDGTVVEFYVRGIDAAGHTRTWPAPVAPSGLQQANLLYQVLDAFDPQATPWTPGSSPIYFEVMTAAERSEFESIDRRSDAQMNATFISWTGTGVEVRYNAGVRIRGSGSRSHNPPNNRINLPSDRPWHGVDAMNINIVAPRNQIAGSALFRLAGLPTADAKSVFLISNGVNLNGTRPYAHIETLNTDFADNHFPQDNGGNLYKGRRPNESPPGGQGAGLVYFGPDPAPYVSYTKLTNASQADWSDVIHLTDVLNNAPDATYVQQVMEVADVDQWLRFFALNALLDNSEGGLVNGDRLGDDYAMYRGIDDPRFRMIPHDLDSLFSRTNRPFFRATGVPALNRLIRHPEFLPRYYAQLLDLMDNVLLTDRARTTLEEALRDVGNVDTIISFLERRAAFVRAQIPQTFTVDVPLPKVGDTYRTTVPRLTLTGRADVIATRSVLVNGQPADPLPGDGTWSLAGAQPGGELETLLPAGAVWKYLDDGSDQGTAWRAPDFDDAQWPAGPAPLGYGDGNESTVVGFIDTTPETPGSVSKNATTYFRTTFSVDDPARVAGLSLRMRYDDAAAVYINGVEAVRTDNLPTDAAFDTYSVIDTPDESAFFSFDVAPEAQAALVAGENTIAVEIHQGDAFSSDIKLDLELTAFRSTGPGGLLLNPGLNRITVEAFDGPGGTGRLLDTQTFDVLYDGPAASTRVVAPEPRIERLDLATRDSYLPGIPLLVRLAARDAEDRVARRLWDGVVHLSTDRPDVALSQHEVRLINGQGSALVMVEGEGDFTLTARLGQRTVERRIRSLAGTPVTTVAGTLAGESTRWSGVVRLTDSVVVPAGHTLSIEPGTVVLLDGDPIGAIDSTSISVQGTLVSQGTPAAPITWTATDPDRPWGQIDLNGGVAELAYTALHRAGNAIRLGHTNTGAAVRLRNGARFTLRHGSISDVSGKILQSTSGEVLFDDALLARAVMGPEIQRTALDFADSWITDMAGVYHYAGIEDDNDGIYLHDQQPGQTIRLSGGVVANTRDDGIDTLRADVTITDMVVRDIVDKAVSVFDGQVRIDRSLLVRADIGVNTKGAGRSTPHTIIDRTTIADVRQAVVAQDKDAPDPDVRITYDITNSILRVVPGGDAVATDYDPADLHIDYSNVAEPWPGTGNIDVDPLFYDPAGGDYRLQPGSPSINAGDPAALDAGGSRADQGYRGDGIAGAFAPATLGGTLAGTVILTPYGGPYQVTEDVRVAEGARLILLPGTTVYFDADTGITVQGTFEANGSAYQRIRLTSPPDAPPVPDLPGLPDGPPRWDGVRLVNTMSDRNVIARTDIEYAQSSLGSIGAVGSQVLVDGVTVRGTHRRMVYASRSSLTVRNSIFPDMFAPGESPAALHLDNVAEHIKSEGTIPAGGHFIIENNVFGTNKGHNDVIDVVSGTRPNPIVEIRDNVFFGAGDELLDLGGDVYITGNLFAHVAKDDDSSDRGYANAISTGDGPTRSTIVADRNIFWDVDHAINLKRGTATIFQNNTVVGVHDDFVDRFGNLNVGSAINLFVDEPGAQPGRGAFVAGNIFSGGPRVFGNIDLPAGTTSDLWFENNLVTDALAAAPLGERLASLFDLGPGYRVGGPRFVDAARGDFTLRPGSPAIGAGPLGHDLGALVPPGAWIAGEPPERTADRSAALRLGGPGIFAVKYRLDGGPWSEPIPVGAGFQPDGGTVRSVTVPLTDLALGPHSVEVLGQDFAGRWQESPTRSKTWTVVSGSLGVRINEVLAINRSAWPHEGGYPDMIELFNPGSETVDLSGMRLSDHVSDGDGFVFPDRTRLDAGAYLLLAADDAAAGDANDLHLGFSLDGAGEGVFLYDGQGHLVDSVAFGPQIPDRSIGRVGHEAAWSLTQPTPGSANRVQPTGDLSRLKINEWLASGDVRVEDDFLELYNPDPLPVDLGGVTLSDKPDAIPDRFRAAPLSFVDGQQFVRFVADGKPEKGPDHLTFRLSADEELLALFAADGTELDRVLYYPQTTDVSQGRAPDGATTSYAFSRLPTPGAANLQPPSLQRVVDIDWDALWRYEQSGADLGTAWREPDFDDSAWPSGPGLLGLDADTLPQPIRTELTLGEVTYYFRKHFTIGGDPSDLTLQLRTIIDDGAVVYVNGQELVRMRLPQGPVDANDTAGTVVVAREEGPFQVPPDMLMQGDNVIAVEVHQNGAGSADVAFGLSAVGTRVAPPPQTEALLKVLDHLRISEIVYHPASADGAEFVELLNTGAGPLELNGVRLRGGIDFTFPPLSLEPGGHVVVTDDVARFQAEYGKSIPVAGAYSGKLSNNSDTIVLEMPAPIDAAILRFAYRDDWYPQTDGGGQSLGIRDAAAPPAAWRTASAWQPQVPSPGSSRPVVRGDLDVDADIDFDDIGALVLGLAAPADYTDAYGDPAQLRGDLDDDGDLDFDDIGRMVSLLGGRPTPLAGDLDLSGAVDFDDIGALVQGLVDPAAYQAAYGVDASVAGDLDDDGDFDYDDIDPFTGVLEAAVGAPPDSAAAAGIAQPVFAERIDAVFAELGVKQR